MSQTQRQSRVLIVDDTPDVLRLLAQILETDGCQVLQAPNGKIALQIAERAAPDLILLDIQMPEMDGYETCEQLKGTEKLEGIPVIFVSGLGETLDKVKAFQLGAVDYITKPFQEEELLARVRTHLRLRELTEHLETRVKERTQELALANQQLQHYNQELNLAYDLTLEGWAKALELRDPETKDHSQQVIDLTLQLSRVLGISDEDFVHVYRGALLHDIGKMGIPDSILLKPGALSDDEWEIMKQHPVYAYDMLSSITYLHRALEIPYCHHEKWDGSGYPRGLESEQIPLSARIFALVDNWDALRSDRPYRKAWSREKALDYIREKRGSHFDPRVVDAFVELTERDN
jgi:putative two-component system response regulator